MSDSETDIDLKTDVELVDLDSLEPYANNPKSHPEQQVQKIADSIENYGFDQPIVIDGDGEIIKGHGRFEASKKLGLDAVPVVWQDGLSPEQVKAARIADNKVALDAGFDYHLLDSELVDLQGDLSDSELSELTGFDTSELPTDPPESSAIVSETAEVGSSEGGSTPGGNTTDGSRSSSDPDDAFAELSADYEARNSGPTHECPECGSADVREVADD